MLLFLLLLSSLSFMINIIIIMTIFITIIVIIIIPTIFKPRCPLRVYSVESAALWTSCCSSLLKRKERRTVISTYYKGQQYVQKKSLSFPKKVSQHYQEEGYYVYFASSNVARYFKDLTSVIYVTSNTSKTLHKSFIVTSYLNDSTYRYVISVSCYLEYPTFIVTIDLKDRTWVIMSIVT